MKTKDKKRSGRYSYLNDFKPTGEKTYEYIGNVYGLDMDREEGRKTVRNDLILLAVCISLLLVGGTVPFEGMMNAFYVILPFVFEVAFAALLIVAVYNICSHEELREYIYNKSAKRLKVLGSGLMGNSIIRLLTSAVYVLINGIDRTLPALIYFLALALEILLEIRAVPSLIALKFKLIRQRQEEEKEEKKEEGES